MCHHIPELRHSHNTHNTAPCHDRVQISTELFLPCQHVATNFTYPMFVPLSDAAELSILSSRSQIGVLVTENNTEVRRSNWPCTDGHLQVPWAISSNGYRVLFLCSLVILHNESSLTGLISSAPAFVVFNLFTFLNRHNGPMSILETVSRSLLYNFLTSAPSLKPAVCLSSDNEPPQFTFFISSTLSQTPPYFRYVSFSTRIQVLFSTI